MQKEKYDAKYEQLFKTMSEGFALHEIICDKNGIPIDYRFLDINPAFEKLVGLKKKDIINKTVLEVLPNTEPSWIKRYGEIALTGNTMEFEQYNQELNKYFKVVGFSPQKGQFAVLFYDTSDFKEIEYALQQREEQFRQAFDFAAIGMALITSEGKCFRANSSLCRMLGYSEEELLNTSFHSITHPDDLEKSRSYLKKLRSGKIPRYAIEKRYKHKNGHWIWIDVNVSAVRNENQNLQYFIIQVQNISDRKTTEETLKRQLKFTEALDALSTSIAKRHTIKDILDEITYRIENSFSFEFGGITIWDEAVEAFVLKSVCSKGRSKAEQMGLVENASILPDQLKLIETMESDKPGILYLQGTRDNELSKESLLFKERLKESGIESIIVLPIHPKERRLGFILLFCRGNCSISQMEYRFLSNLLEHIIIAINNNQLYQELKDSYNKLLGAEKQQEKQIHWMTVRKIISSEIVKRNDFKSISQVLLQKMYNILGYKLGFVGIIDEQMTSLRIISMYPDSHSVAEKNDLSHGGEILADREFLASLELDTVNVRILDQLHISSDERVCNTIQQSLSEQGIVMMVILPISDKKRIRAVLGFAFKKQITFDKYEKIFFRAIASDLRVSLGKEDMVKELQLSYENLKQAQTAILEQERLNAMGQMASGIAHDINNTLAPIALYTDALLEGEENLSDRARRFLKIIKDATGDIESTIGRLRMFYRKTEGDILNQKNIDFIRLIKNVIDMTRPRWENLPNKSGSTIKIITELPDGNTTFIGIEHEIREALVNLVFNAVDAMPNGGTITFRAVEHKQNIVLEVEDTGMGMNEEQRQRCLEPFFTTKGERGSGLGMSSVLGVMERCQGQMEIESKEGKGTTVRLIFPVQELSGDKRVSKETPISLPSLRILCIDDEQMVRNSLSEILEMDGHDSIVAENGEEGIMAIREALEGEKGFDVVITDLGMPDMDGWEVAERIKKLTPQTPIILLSGWGNLMNGNEEKTQDVDVVLGKPPNIGEIRQALHSLISLRSKRIESDEK